ncbi:hypothetical protein KAT08_01795 [Candidatus Babeliales bacterium]|nr:hypothetical protein [Candidatus Babeliales bacterium]
MNINLIAILKKEKRFLLFLFLFSFFIRAIIFGFILSKDRKYFTFDSSFHNEVGMEFSKGRGLVRVDGAYAFWKVPGYAIFLGLVYSLFGQDELKAIFFQIFLSSFLPILIFFLSLVLFSNAIILAKITSIYGVFHLGYVLFSGLMMTESIFCLFFLLFLIFFLSQFNFFFCKEAIKDFSLRKSFCGGVFLGAASLIRPVGHYLILLLILMMFFDNVPFIIKLKKLGLLVFGWGLIIFWLLLRNYFLTGYIFFNTMPGNHFLYYVAVPIDMYMNNNSAKESSEKLLEKELKELIKKEKKDKCRKLQEIEESIIAQKLAYNYILKKPFLFVKNAIYNMIKTCISFHSSHILAICGHYPEWCYEKGVTFNKRIKKYLFPPIKNNFLKFIIFLEIIFSFFILVGFAGGIIKSFFKFEFLCSVLKFLPIMCFMIFLTFASGISRLRLPIEPFFIIIAFNFWLNILKRRKGLFSVDKCNAK